MKKFVMICLLLTAVVSAEYLEEWCITWPGLENTICYGMELDEDGNIYLLGMEEVTDYEGYPILVKFDLNGNYLWHVRCFNEVQGLQEADICYSSKHLTISSAGNPIVLFDREDTDRVSATEYDSETHAVVWAIELPDSEASGPATGDYSMVTDDAGNTFVHYTLDTYAPSWRTVCIDEAGLITWEYTPQYGFCAGDITIAENGYLVSTGMERLTPGAPMYEMQNIALDPDSGTFIWEVLMGWQGGSPNMLDQGTRIMSDPEGNLVATAFSRYYSNNAKGMIITRLDETSGEVLWTEQYRESTVDVALDIAFLTDSGRIVIGGYSSPYWCKGLILFYDLADGGNIATATVGHEDFSDRFYEVEAVPENRAVVTGMIHAVDDSVSSFYVGIYDSDAIPLQEFYGSLQPGVLEAVGRAVQVDDAGNIFAAGYALNSSGKHELMLIKYTENVGAEEETHSAVNPAIFTLSAPSPCPAAGLVSFQVNAGHESYLNATVYDLNGRMLDTIHSGLLSSGTHSLTWNCSDQPPGLYILRAEISGTTLTERIVVSR